jgi:hypothetical protein
MELKLFWQMPIKEVKKQFAKNFPYLKIDFFWQKHHSAEGSSLQQKVDEKLALSAIRITKKEGVFSYKPQESVADFEQRLQNEFGLSVQVFRKASDVWIETIQTDSLSLEKQNKMGETSSKPMPFNLNSLFL